MRKIITNGFLWYTNHVGKIIFWTCFAAIVVLILERVAIIFSYQGHLAGIDNNFEYPIIRSLAGFSIYPDPNAYPYAVNPYAPGFFILCKWIATALHHSADDTFAIYRIGRTIALLADLGSCWILYSLLRTRAELSRAASLIWTSFFLIILCFLGYSFNRSDCLFLFFYCLSVYLLLSPVSAHGAMSGLVLAVSVGLALFSKQNGFSLLVLVPLWLAMKRNYKSLAFFVCFILLLCFGGYYYFEFISSRHHFSEHVFQALRNRVDPKWFYIYIFKLLADSHLILPLLLAAIVSGKALTENRKPLLSSLSALYLTQLLINLGLCFKWGSSLGYFNESFFLSLIVLAIWARDIFQSARGSLLLPFGAYLYPVLLIFILHVGLQLYFYYIHNTGKARVHFEEQVALSQYIKKEIGGNDLYVLDLSRPDVDFYKNLLYKESAAPNFDAVDCCTLPDRIFNYSGMIQGLRNGKVLFLIEGNSNPEKTIWNTPLDHYLKDTTIGDNTLYRFDLKRTNP
jgi:hypothetical protein